MASRDIAVIVLAAGRGTRMKSARPKVLHAVGGRAMVAHVLDAVAPLAPARTAIVVGPGMDAVADAVAPLPTVEQPRQMGTADAVMAARPLLDGFAGDVLVAYADTPLVEPETYRRLIEARRAAGAAAAILGFRPADPTGYGRLIVGAEGALEAIVEERDASAEQRRLPLCNGGVMALDGQHLFDLLGRIGNDNAKGEFYLTDIVAVARADGGACVHVESADPTELVGVNSRADLAVAEAVFQSRARARAMADGATLIDPTTVWFSWDTTLAADVTIEPNVVFGPGVSVAEGAEIRAFCHIAGAEIGARAVIGPFARIRPDTAIGDEARVGNFVEVKNATFGVGAKASHLAYVGDAEIGSEANVGAGVITCNYDGIAKHRTVIGDGAFIGSNVALVAPVTVGPNAVIGAGSTITRDVPGDALAVARGEQKTVADGAARLRETQRARADEKD